MVSVIIGFNYFNSTSTEYIPGTVVDVYRVYRHSIKIGLKPFILTDITDFKLPEGISKEIVNGLNPGILEFLNEGDKSCEFRSLVTTPKELLSILLKIISEQDKILFYFTGHGLTLKDTDTKEDKHGIVTPNGDLLDIREIYNILVEKSRKNSNIFMIMDCCYPSSMSLPFRYVLSSNKFKLCSTEFISQNIILLTSSSEDQKSGSLTTGSFFTKFLFTILGKLSPLSVRKLFKEINVKTKEQKYVQNMNLYSSYPIINSVISGFIVRSPLCYLFSDQDDHHTKYRAKDGYLIMTL